MCIGNHTTLSSIWNLFAQVYFSKSIKIPESTEKMPFELFKKKTMCTSKLQIEEKSCEIEYSLTTNRKKFS